MNGVFLASCDVLAISRLFSVVYIRRQDFIHSERFRERECVVQRKIAECSKKALFCSDCYFKNQAIILVVFSLVSL